MILWGILCFILLVLLLLCIPVTYGVALSARKISIGIAFLFGIFSKEWSYVRKATSESSEEAADTSSGEAAHMREILCQAEGEAEIDQEASTKGKEKEENETVRPALSKHNASHVEEDPLEEEETSWDDNEMEEDEKEKPSLMDQFRFALQNGLLEKIYHTVMECIRHSWPRYCRIEGEFGTGDPMETGCISGLTAAFFPRETQGILWNYIDPVMKLSGKVKGKVLPIYVLYIGVVLILSKEARAFWHYRKEGVRHG